LLPIIDLVVVACDGKRLAKRFDDVVAGVTEVGAIEAEGVFDEEHCVRIVELPSKQTHLFCASLYIDELLKED
jgi:hypothetical protein